MKKAIFGVVTVIAVLMIVGTVGDLYLHSEHGYVVSQKKQADLNAHIEALEDSIGRLNDKVDILQATLDILRIVDSTKVEEAEQLLWNIKVE